MPLRKPSLWTRLRERYYKWKLDRKRRKKLPEKKN